MRVVSLESILKGHQPLYVFNFLFLILNILNEFKVLSRSMQKWIQPAACLVHDLHRILSSYWLAHCYLMKESTKVHAFLVWIAEWWSSSLPSRNPKDNWCLSRIYGVRFGKKDHDLSTCKPWGGLEAFLHGVAQNFELLSNIQDQK
jgi:hypothetical protein